MNIYQTWCSAKLRVLRRLIVWRSCCRLVVIGRVCRCSGVCSLLVESGAGWVCSVLYGIGILRLGVFSPVGGYCLSLAGIHQLCLSTWFSVLPCFAEGHTGAELLNITAFLCQMIRFFVAGYSNMGRASLTDYFYLTGEACIHLSAVSLSLVGLRLQLSCANLKRTQFFETNLVRLDYWTHNDILSLIIFLPISIARMFLCRTKFEYELVRLAVNYWTDLRRILLLGH
jgi:hypothetical protein